MCVSYHLCIAVNPVQMPCDAVLICQIAIHTALCCTSTLRSAAYLFCSQAKHAQHSADLASVTQSEFEILFSSQNVWLQSDDQGLVNSDPRNIAVPDTFINNIPTDIRGLTFSRTPQQLINMYSLGNPSGIGPFFPNGFSGAINSPVGYINMATGLEDFPASPMDAFQVRHCVFSAWTQHMPTDKAVAG